MRWLSCLYTERSVLTGRKTETRRKGWKNLKPGTKLLLVRKSQGRRKGEPVVKLAEVYVENVYREPLCTIDRTAIKREGLKCTPQEFIAHFCRAMKVKQDDTITVIRWSYVQWFHDPPLAVGNRVRTCTICTAKRRLRFHYGTVVERWDDKFVRVRFDNTVMKPCWFDVSSLCRVEGDPSLPKNRFETELRERKERDEVRKMRRQRNDNRKRANGAVQQRTDSV